jgi:hypothetical protein
VHAQDDLAAASAAFERAEFAEAIEAYDRAASGDGLTRAQVLVLLEGRALARHATRDPAGAEADLVALLSLEPEAELGETAPPALRRELERLRGEAAGRIELGADASRVPDGFVVTSRVRNDVASLVSAVRVHWQAQGEWQRAEGREVRVPAGSSLSYYVEAIGPGGAVLASHGTLDSPERVGALETTTVEEMRPAPPPPSDDSGLWIGLGVGAAVIVAAVAIVLAIVLAPPPGTQPMAPMELP